MDDNVKISTKPRDDNRNHHSFHLVWRTKTNAQQTIEWTDNTDARNGMTECIPSQAEWRPMIMHIDRAESTARATPALVQKWTP